MFQYIHTYMYVGNRKYKLRTIRQRAKIFRGQYVRSALDMANVFSSWTALIVLQNGQPFAVLSYSDKLPLAETFKLGLTSGMTESVVISSSQKGKRRVGQLHVVNLLATKSKDNVCTFHRISLKKETVILTSKIKNCMNIIIIMDNNSSKMILK